MDDYDLMACSLSNNLQNFTQALYVVRGYLKAQNNGLLSMYQPAGQYLSQDGSFDLDTAKEDYKIFLQSAPEKNKICLEQALDAVIYNPSNSDFAGIDFTVSMTHELGHRVDEFFIRTWENEEFSQAIAAGSLIFLLFTIRIIGNKTKTKKKKSLPISFPWKPCRIPKSCVGLQANSLTSGRPIRQFSCKGGTEHV